MSTDLHNLQHVHNLDREIVARYTDQPPRLPPELRRRIEASWHGAPVQLYALADLDHALRLTQVWVALGPGHLAVARPVDLTETWEIETVERARIQAGREAPGLSASTLTLLGRPGEPPLAVLRSTPRQRRRFENLKFGLEQAPHGARRPGAIAWLAVAAMALVYVVRQAAAVVRLRLMSVLGEWVARDLRAELYEHLQRLSLAFFSRKRTGSLITRVSADTDRLWEFLAFGVVDVSLSLVMLAGLGAVLVSLDWRLGLVMTLPVPLFCWAIYRHGEVLNRVFLRVWRKWSRLTDVLSDTMPGIRVVKAFNQEAREVARFVGHNDDVTDEINRLHALWTTFWPLLMLAVHATTIGVWVLAVPRLLGGGAALSAGTFVSFLLYTTMFVGPIEVIGQMARTMQRATTSAHRVFEVLDTEPDVTDAPQPVRLEPVRGRVTFEHVSFAYDGVRQVLRGVSFEVAPGELIGLVGPSGGGKTTIVNLIARFYDVTGGAIRIDGVDVRRLETGHYRRQIGMVLQDPYLFHGTVLENIRYGLPAASLEQAVAAARAANAHDFICKLQHGYDTVVGERGHTLSGGERQRVSIARAILHDPRILILDEATSSVDTETERQIQEALERLIAGRTVFAIAHRLSTLRKASRLLVIADGRLVESGTHAELLAQPEGDRKSTRLNSSHV